MYVILIKIWRGKACPEISFACGVAMVICPDFFLVSYPDSLKPLR